MFKIGGLNVSENEPAKIVAELGINHGGDLSVAKKMAELAVANGADVIKHQTHIPEAEMSREAEHIRPGNDSRNIFSVIQESALSLTEEMSLAQHVRDLGVPYLSTPFSREAADFLDEVVGVDTFKIGSGECNNIPFLEYVSRKGKPIILSTGMNSTASVKESVTALEKYDVDYALMHTTNLYPTPSRLLRLGGINELKSAFPGTEVGLSDHSTSNTACVAAVALGASFIERHFTDSKDRIGPDISSSMDPQDLRILKTQVHEVFLAKGGSKELAEEETVTAKFAFASLSSTREINAGDLLTPENIWPMRPSGGEFSPSDFYRVIGRKAKTRIPARTQLSENMLVSGDS